MKKGTVKFFDDDKRYGFIQEDGSEKEHFVHATGCVDRITKGDMVEFELAEGQKGINAVNVKIAQ
tara:strand:- start:287 stop:481 length:195 start_codon:yes stop_codon:yes gene_type:complete